MTGPFVQEWLLMNVGVLTGIVSVILALIGRVTVASRRDRLRRRIEATNALYKELQGAAGLEAAAEAVESIINDQARHLALLEKRWLNRRFDFSQPVIGGLVSVGAGYGAYRLYSVGHWYGKLGCVLVALFALLCIYAGIKGLFVSEEEDATASK